MLLNYLSNALSIVLRRATRGQQSFSGSNPSLRVREQGRLRRSVPANAGHRTLQLRRSGIEMGHG